MSQVTPIRTIAEFLKHMNSGVGYVFITDEKNAEKNKIHFIELGCGSLKKSFFEKKIVCNAEEHGKYFYSDSIMALVEYAKKEIPKKGVKICGTCMNKLKPLIN